jgi:hypothetical protein
MADLEFRLPNRSRLTPPALVDTGAYLSAIDPRLCKEFERAKLIEPVPFAGSALTHTVALGGGTGEYQLGRLRGYVVGLTDTGVTARHPVTILAQLFEKSVGLVRQYPFILGLHAGAFDGLRLIREPLEPLPGPVPADRIGDCGEYYGQRWYLESV